MVPKIISGGKHRDERGNLFFNNDLDFGQVKRIYFIENINTSIVRGWQGHKIEKRWFSAVSGKIKISVKNIAMLNDLEIFEFILDSNTMDYLYIPENHIIAIRSLEENSKLMVMADYGLGEINDEYRFPFES